MPHTMAFTIHPSLSIARDSRPLRESYTGPFAYVEYHKFFITPETPRCIMQKARDSYHVA
jgi:hypothetical protein